MADETAAAQVATAPPAHSPSRISEEELRDQIRQDERRRVQTEHDRLKAERDDATSKLTQLGARLDQQTQEAQKKDAEIANNLKAFLDASERQMEQLKAELTRTSELVRTEADARKAAEAEKALANAVAKAVQEAVVKYGNKVLPELLPEQFRSAEDVLPAYERANAAYLKYVKDEEPAPTTTTDTPTMPSPANVTESRSQTPIQGAQELSDFARTASTEEWAKQREAAMRRLKELIPTDAMQVRR